MKHTKYEHSLCNAANIDQRPSAGFARAIAFWIMIAFTALFWGSIVLWIFS